MAKDYKWMWKCGLRDLRALAPLKDKSIETILLQFEGLELIAPDVDEAPDRWDELKAWLQEQTSEQETVSNSFDEGCHFSLVEVLDLMTKLERSE